MAQSNEVQDEKSAFFATMGLLVLIAPTGLMMFDNASLNGKMFAGTPFYAIALASLVGSVLLFSVSGYLRQNTFIETLRIVIGAGHLGTPAAGDGK